ncbi:basic helix-loop-helix domain-containing protein USF3 [Emys orbicularis]|uniref:basic helix-loop-helix domain-containing protein USF3 n=1 Tax=Emys orbicularis TaxID=82168 RepID=UPI0031FBFBAE
MPEMTENETPMKKQHRKKNRETHNAVERHRKKKINAGINRIGELIPCSPALKQEWVACQQKWKPCGQSIPKNHTYCEESNQSFLEGKYKGNN